MLRFLLPVSAAVATCAPSPRENAMPPASPVPDALQPSQGAGDREQATAAAQGPVLEPVSAAENSAPTLPADLPLSAEPVAEAKGRKLLSTAFVRVGPDGQLTVEPRNGGVLVLRDVVMRRKDYCGVHVAGGPPGTTYCGRYADVGAARPGGTSAGNAAIPAAANPIEPTRGTPRRR